MSQKLMGKKRGMMQTFTKEGKVIPCTVIEFEPNVVLQKKTLEQDGYAALQLSCGKIITKDKRTLAKRLKKPQLKNFEKKELEPRKKIFEVRGDFETKEGESLEVSSFEGVKHVDVTAVTKGKGFQGVMKKYNFSGGPAAHGTGFRRHAGSTGMRSTPGRCLPGSPRPSRMGGVQQTTQNLEVVNILPEKGIMLVKGAVPGANGSWVLVGKAIKK